MRVALAHDWLTGMRGGEKVLEALCELHPDADIFTLLHRKGSVSPTIERHRIRTSFVQSLPGVDTKYRWYLPLFPAAVEQFDLDGYDLVISTSHCAVKSVIPRGNARHISYSHSPMRYAWDQFDAYFGPARTGAFKSRWLYRPILARLARWDAGTAHRVHRFVANSHYVAGRIRRYYNRDATVVYPPVDTAFYQPDTTAVGGPEGLPHRDAGSHFLIVSALVPYKRIDIAVDACARLGAPLRIVGDGPMRDELQRRAAANIEFLGWRTPAEIREEYRRAVGLLLPGEEDFGIVPVEAQACGCPVVALGRGGALETVIDGETGVFAKDASVDAFAAALECAARTNFDGTRLRGNAERFARERHITHMKSVIDETLAAPAGQRW
jgi:glycosyltransferase involved in cell wall biosynthesis